MNNKMSFLIPFRSDDKQRILTFDYIRECIGDDWPGCEIIVGDSPGEFNRSAARNDAASRATGDILIFVDADTYVPKTQIYAAARRVVSSAWAFPYDSYWAMTLGATERFIYGVNPTEGDAEYIFPSPETPAPSVGGCVVVRRDAFEAAGKWDERFIGWSFEDRAFAAALETIVGPEVRISGNIYHLWHSAPETERFGQPHMEHNRMLYHEYLACAANPARMAQYLNER